jgi:hypothetical protein
MSIEELIERVERLQKRDKYTGPERRKSYRLVYPPKKRPMLKYGNHELEIVDISERGMRLFNYNNHKIKPNIQGTIVFSSGLSIDVKGKIAWHYKNELGLFTNNIPRSIIEEEMYSLLREKGLNKS